MNIIHIFTEVKRQSFSDLAKVTERKRHNDNRKPIVLKGGLWGGSESGYLAIAQSLDGALGLLEECIVIRLLNLCIKQTCRDNHIEIHFSEGRKAWILLVQ